MGTYATTTLSRPDRVRNRAVPSRRRVRKNADPPSKNRVWDFFETTPDRVGFFASQPIETASDTSAVFSETASGLPFWPSRDPIEEIYDAENVTISEKSLYVFVDNCPVITIDILGLWGSAVHKTMTAEWAVEVGYALAGANLIGGKTDAVDGGTTSPLPIVGDQSYHFNTAPAGAMDSRRKHHIDRLIQAKDECDWLGKQKDDDQKAAKHMGFSLHPIQDFFAHGDYPGGFKIHNVFGPQMNPPYSSPRKYPDDHRLDAQTASSRPIGASVRETNKAKYKFGERRITLTKNVSKKTLESFLLHVMQNSKPCGKCRQTFIAPLIP